MRLRDASGNVLFDETDRLPSIIGTYAYSFAAGVQTVQVSVPGVSASTHFAYDATSTCLCLVGQDQVQLQRIRASYSAAESGNFVVFRS